MTPRDRLEAWLARAIFSLPRPVLRAIAGPPVMLDGQELALEAQLAIRLLELSGAPKVETLPVPQARAQLAKDAATFTGRRYPVARVDELELPAGDGTPLRARLYVPRAPSAKVLVYYHGGGFVLGDIDTHDNVCRFFADAADVNVLSPDYRLSPEHRFPIPIEDAEAAFAFAVGEVGEDGAVAVGGDSAGGALAAIVSQRAAAAGGPAPCFQLLLYPWLDLSSKSRSRELFADGFLLSDSELDWFQAHYLGDADPRDPLASPLLAEELEGLPPAYIATAGFDPLRDEAEAYGARLRDAGVPVAVRRHPGLVHGFANTVGALRGGREAMLEAAGALQLGLAHAVRAPSRTA